MSGKSKEEVAFEILSKLKGVGVWGENNQDAILNMYALCLEATSGLREVDGKKPSALRLATQMAAAKSAPAPAAPIAPPAAQLTRATQPAPQQAQPTYQPAPAQPHVQQPDVRLQQQRVQQAYQQQPQPGQAR